jgi:hypothetical protein
METKDKRTKVVAGILVLAGLLGIWTLATAGNLEPNAPPAPTMKTLNEIYDAVTSISQREGYIGHFDVPADSNMPCLPNDGIVPTGKQFVLLKLVLHHSDMKLTKNGSFLTGASYTVNYTEGTTGKTFMDFPDRCVVVNEGESLRIVNPSGSPRKAMIVGYFHSVE